MRRISILMMILFTSSVFIAWAQAPKIITFDAPGAGRSTGQGMAGPGINSAGAIKGFYFDSNNVTQGFVRAPNGRVTTFDAPRAGTETVTRFEPSQIGLGGQGTYPLAIDREG